MDTRTNLLGNGIVLIAPKNSSIGNVTIGQGFDLAKLAGTGRIATGDVSSVPVGKYAKAALEKLGAWEMAAPKFAMAESVRAALTLVARGEAVLGIVYATDAKVEAGSENRRRLSRPILTPPSSIRSPRPPPPGTGACRLSCFFALAGRQDHF